MTEFWEDLQVSTKVLIILIITVICFLVLPGTFLTGFCIFKFMEYQKEYEIKNFAR